MDPQRIHTLLHGRKGPVTKPVLPDKAAAIAEVFMEAGVEVAVVPAPDPVVSFLSGGEPDARPEAGVDSAVESGSGPYDAPAYEPDDEPDFGPEPDLELEAEHYAEAPWGSRASGITSTVGSLRRNGKPVGGPTRPASRRTPLLTRPTVPLTTPPWPLRNRNPRERVGTPPRPGP